MTEKKFYFLCLDKRQSSYKIIVSTFKDKIVFIETLEELLTKSIENPPYGIFVDILTSLRFGAQNIMPIDNLAMRWPVMRCNITSNGSTLVLCMDTPKRDTLPNAISGIINGEEAWFNAENRREYIRMKIRFRAKIKVVGTDKWINGNGRNVGTDGVFIHIYEDLPLGTEVDIEIMDISEYVIKCKGKVAWQRKWEDGIKLPGVGISFDQKTLDFPINHVLTKPENIKMFLSGKL